MLVTGNVQHENIWRAERRVREIRNHGIWEVEVDFEKGWEGRFDEWCRVSVLASFCYLWNSRALTLSKCWRLGMVFCQDSRGGAGRELDAEDIEALSEVDG